MQNSILTVPSGVLNPANSLQWVKINQPKWAAKSIPYRCRERLPRVQGIYLVIEGKPTIENIVYVGKAVDFRGRWSQHELFNILTGRNFITWLPMPGFTLDNIWKIETSLIKKLLPKYNKQHNPTYKPRPTQEEINQFKYKAGKVLHQIQDSFCQKVVEAEPSAKWDCFDISKQPNINRAVQQIMNSYEFFDFVYRVGTDKVFEAFNQDKTVPDIHRLIGMRLAGKPATMGDAIREVEDIYKRISTGLRKCIYARLAPDLMEGFECKNYCDISCPINDDIHRIKEPPKYTNK